MALQASTVWELRGVNGSDNNGGGFTSGGTDYSQQNTAQLELTDLATAGAGVDILTSVAGGFTSAMVGNIIYIRSGTNFDVGWYEIVGFTNANTVTLDRSATAAGAGINGAGNVGGARKTFTDAWGEAFIAGNKLWVKNETVTQGGAVGIANSGTAAARIVVEGYNSARGDVPTIASGNQPTIACGANNFIFNDWWQFKYITVTTTNATGWQADQSAEWFKCKISGSTRGITLGAASGDNFQKVIGCDLTLSGNGTAVAGTGNGVSHIIGSHIHDLNSSSIGIGNNGNPVVAFNLFSAIAGKSYFNANSNNNFQFISNTFYGAETPAGTGMDFNSGDRGLVINNIFYGLATAVTNAADHDSFHFYYNDFFNNTTNRTNLTAGATDIAIDPQFTDAAGGDFSVGANMQGAGFPGAFGSTATTGYYNVGAAQNQASSGGGGWFSGE